MPTVIKRDPKRFLKELRIHYGDVWKMPSSQYLASPDFVVVDPKTAERRQRSASFPWTMGKSLELCTTTSADSFGFL